MPFDCCSNFRPLMTSRGVCFSLNSRQTDGSANEEMFVVSHRKPEASIHLKFTEPVQVFVHDPGEVGFLRGARKAARLAKEARRAAARGSAERGAESGAEDAGPAAGARRGQRRVLAFGLREVRAHPSAWLLTRGQRRCALPGERRARAYRAASRSACLDECRARAQLRRCNCSHPLLPRFGGDPECDYQGLQCLDRHFRPGGRGEGEGQERKKLKCRCLPDCAVTDINVVQDSVTSVGGDLSETIVRVAAPPNQRLTLTARVTTLDIIVGVACLSRLVTSMSLADAAVAALRLGTRAAALLGRLRRPRAPLPPAPAPAAAATPAPGIASATARLLPVAAFELQ